MTCRMGIDLGGTKTEVLVLDARAAITVYRERFAYAGPQDYALILARIGDEFSRARQRFGADLTLGIGIPGALSPRSGLLRNSNTQCLNGRPLRDDLEALLALRSAHRKRCQLLCTVGGARRCRARLPRGFRRDHRHRHRRRAGGRWQAAERTACNYRRMGAQPAALVA